MVSQNKEIPNEMNTVSVVMCTYNGEKFLEEQLNSILSQSHTVQEIIIVDDCSKDNTWNILTEYQNKYPSLIFIYQNKTNVGYGENFNRALSLSKGDFIAFSDQDDIWVPEKIETLCSIIENNLLAIGNSSLFYVDQEVNENLNLFSNQFFQTFSIEKLIWENSIPGHAFMIRKEVVDLYMKLKKKDISHDAAIALFCYGMGSVSATEKVIQYWRRHPEAHTADNKFDFKIKKGYQKTIITIFKLLTRKKSPIIERGWNNINLIFKILLLKHSHVKNIDKLCQLSIYMSKQSFYSYIQATYICWKLRVDMFGIKHAHTIKEKYFIYTYVFRWWYDHQYDMSI
jgi:glycosyltransferase involved in cell wall biosynthesis